MKALAEKVLVLGIDGMDPRLSLYHMEQGYMPNLKKLLERGAAREDLVLLGGMPTITPPMWTTLATGTYPMTHGITDFWRQDPNKLDTLNYALDSRQLHKDFRCHWLEARKNQASAVQKFSFRLLLLHSTTVLLCRK